MRVTASFIPSVEARQTTSGKFDLAVQAVFQEKTGKANKPIALKGPFQTAVERFGKSEVFIAGHGAVQYVRFGGQPLAQSVAFVGLGLAQELTIERLRVAGGHLWAKIKAEKDSSILIDLDSWMGAKGLKSELSPLEMAVAFAEGLVLPAYEFTKHKTSVKDSKAKIRPSLVFYAKEKGLVQKLNQELPKVLAAAEAMRVARDWSNEPSNYGTPAFFAAEARKFAREYGLKCKVLTEKDAAREKMGLFLGVGQGAEREGCVVVLEYTPKGSRKNLKTLALVGKGVTFDSGGISIKPSLNMENMKHDMTGAATVMGAVLLASAWQVPNRVIAVMAFTENMPSGNAIQPGNVLVSRSGKTVEIINTDAEGRLILADVLDYAQEFKPDALIDVATLTGAVSVALGKLCCGVMGNNDELMESIRRAGALHGERVWQLPLWDEYFDDLKSETADMRNSANDGNGGTIRGAAFLKQFIKKDVAWAHMDIASMAANVSYLSYYPKKGASGSYVRALARLAADF